jgi:thiol-disulfide isomerase/thioredoxin
MKEAAERIKKLATEEDKALPEYAEALGLLFGRRVVELDLWFGPHDPGRLREERRELIADLKEYFAKNAKPSEPAIHAARQLGIRLEFGEKPKDAIPIYQELGPALASSADPQAASTGLKMLGAARRLGLVGKPLELTGTALDGGKFDLQTLRGKVVLVDFWATWCRPCLAEMPNVKKNYELYHDKGFEVVGISLDDDRAALEKFLSAEQHPWITLYDGEWDDSPVATYYGIMGIPSVILVGQDGNVVATDALGPKLGKLLAELLGPVQDSETSGESSKSDAAEVN